MQTLPLGIQTFSKIREDNFLYVDKTKQISRLLTSGSYFFFARPRRFGKSLLLSTVKSIFEGRKYLFKGLWIENNWNWDEKHPVIHIGFSSIGHKELGLEAAISKSLKKQATGFGIQLTATNPSGQFKELIEKVGEKQQAVLLIDEYDKPLIDYLGETEIEQALENQDVLKTFYSVIKDSDAYLKFLLITGVSKFARVSIFSELNNVVDISMERQFGDLVGITQGEMEANFQPHIDHALTYIEGDKEQLLKKIKDSYNGYSWGGLLSVYNPFSLMSFFRKAEFGNYWFETGTPTFLLKQIRKFKKVKFENIKVNIAAFSSYDIANLQLLPLMFQTGYLTIKGRDKFGLYELGYPNEEVKESMLQFMIGEFRKDEYSLSDTVAIQLYQAFENNDLDKAMLIVKSIFKNIPHQIFLADKEFYYHSLIYLIFMLLGQHVDCEVNTNDGRLDAVLKTADRIYVIEFKLDKSAETALKQIKDKGYHEKFLTDVREKVLVGINFSSKLKSVESWLSEISQN